MDGFVPIGAQEIDLVLLVMNQAGIEHLLRNTFTLGDILLTHKVPTPPEAKPLLTALVQVSRAEGQPAGGIR